MWTPSYSYTPPATGDIPREDWEVFPYYLHRHSGAQRLSNELLSTQDSMTGILMARKGELAELQVEDSLKLQFLRGLIDEEVLTLSGDDAGYRKILIRGFIQGCATGISAGLNDLNYGEAKSLHTFMGS
ncbi:hypothetical protein N7478_008235 [Penicillium angulare]|uniref:uncharacterized protein n=1 Tax=Penicillium angulare TaxID=116970 RepID=UPI00253FFDBA|nr:uncharacterized protein N7478_008235 [Penicillium angulare]KAJ5273110.1 hypothetical protein N7478_008235 [Penicillium angulare]